MSDYTEALKNIIASTSIAPNHIINVYPLWVSYSVSLYNRLTSYLDEKGVTYMLGNGSMVLKDVTKPAALDLLRIPVRLYHEVIVPGLLDFCKRNHIAVMPVQYVGGEMTNTRSMFLTLRIKYKEVPFNVLEQAHEAFNSSGFNYIDWRK